MESLQVFGIRYRDLLQDKVISDHSLHLHGHTAEYRRGEARALSSFFGALRQEGMTGDCVGSNDSPRFINQNLHTDGAS